MDITKCTNWECTIKHECWRFVSPSSEIQSYSNFVEVDWYCEQFYPIAK